MSIHDVIRECVDGGELIALRPLIPSAPRNRDVFVTHRVFQFLAASRNVPRPLLKKAIDSRVALDRFIAGAPLSVGMDPFAKRAYAEIARTDPTTQGIWTFRIRDPKPQIRIFGGFAARDIFVAIDFRRRDDLDFDAAAATCRLLWDDLFGDLSPVTEEKIDAYLSDGYHLV